jgi:hypothetical protein
MWKNIVEPGRSQMTIRLMRFARWMTKAIKTGSEYVILIAFFTPTMVAKTLNISLSRNNQQMSRHSTLFPVN